MLSGWSGHPRSRERRRILVRKDREDTVLSEEKGTASHATRRSLVRLGQCGEEAGESSRLVGQEGTGLPPGTNKGFF